MKKMERYESLAMTISLGSTLVLILLNILNPVVIVLAALGSLPMYYATLYRLKEKRLLRM